VTRKLSAFDVFVPFFVRRFSRNAFEIIFQAQSLILSNKGISLLSACGFDFSSSNKRVSISNRLDICLMCI
jgi:hypothetical protein